MDKLITQTATTLSNRYGPLALARAAGEANAARQAGDTERTELLHGVISHLRQGMTGCPLPDMA